MNTRGSKKSKLGILAIMKALPKMPISEAQFAEELRKTIKNVSVRMTVRQAATLVFLDVECCMSKATVVKKCVNKSLDDVLREATAGLQELNVHALGNNASIDK